MMTKKSKGKQKVAGSMPSVPAANKKSHVMSGAGKGRDTVQNSTPKNAQTLDRKMKGTF